jgi:hypothetical protein
MPRKPRELKDYSKTIIYKIVCNDVSIIDFYIGHTTNYSERWRTHKSRSITWELPLYQKIREIGGIENWSMIEIAKCPCNNKREAEKFERDYIELLKPTLCKTTRPIITDEERKIKHKECDAIYQANFSEEKKKMETLRKVKYTAEHKDIRYTITECQCGGKYMYQNKSQHFKSQKHKNYELV